MLVDQDGKLIRTLLPNNLQTLSDKQEIDFPSITAEEIEDKSKGDFLSKGLVLLQTSWFVVQCIARTFQHLPITELELVTLAFATLNFITYWLWWNKPLDAKRYVPVIYKGTSEEGSSREKIGVFEWLGSIPQKIRNWAGVNSWWKLIFLGPFLPVLKMMSFDKDEVAVGAKRIRTFFALNLDDKYNIWAILASLCVASIFGGLHCVAWSFTFPSPTEQLLWRIASVSITASPILIFVVGFVAANVHGFDLVVAAAMILLGAIYIISRLALLILPFMALRSLPSAAYQTVRWTTFIPHV